MVREVWSAPNSCPKPQFPSFRQSCLSKRQFHSWEPFSVKLAVSISASSYCVSSVHWAASGGISWKRTSVFEAHCLQPGRGPPAPINCLLFPECNIYCVDVLMLKEQISLNTQENNNFPEDKIQGISGCGKEWVLTTSEEGVSLKEKTQEWTDLNRSHTICPSARRMAPQGVLLPPSGETWEWGPGLHKGKAR